MADVGRTIGRDHVLHLRDDRQPKGVVYSHRSTWLHSMASTTTNSIGLSERDRCLLIVPMFHVNAWGAAYTAFFAGTELIMPQMFLQGEPIVKMIQELRPTISLGVPTSGTTSFAPRRTTPTPISRAFAASWPAAPPSHAS